MDTNSTITIGGICLLLGAGIGYVGFIRNIKKDVKQETKEDEQCKIDDTREKVQMGTKLDILLMNNTEIKNEIRSVNDKFDKFKDDFGDRLTRCEESTKQAHKRIDEIKK